MFNASEQTHRRVTPQIFVEIHCVQVFDSNPSENRSEKKKQKNKKVLHDVINRTCRINICRYKLHCARYNCQSIEIVRNACLLLVLQRGTHETEIIISIIIRYKVNVLNLWNYRYDLNNYLFIFFCI